MTKSAVGMTSVVASLCCVLSGCSRSQYGGADSAPCATIVNADRVTLHEGLPHPSDESKAFENEKKAKQTVELDGHSFYHKALDLKEEDAGKLKRLLGDSSSFEPFSGEKKCGGFHPDYAVEWSLGGEVHRCLICFGCHEALVSGPAGSARYDIQRDAFDRLKAMLTPYRRNRPAPASGVG